MRSLLCRLLGHHHGQAVIFVTYREGFPTFGTSQVMDEWDANWIVANLIAPTGMWNGRAIVSCRVVVQ